MYRLLSLAFVALTVSAASAQRAPMKWGDIPEDQLAMTDFPADTNASAVVLGAFGETYFSRGLVYKIHRRIKLLRESAYDDWGTVKIRYVAGRDGSRVRDLKAQTITTGADGDPVYHKVDRGSIFKEKIGEDLEQLSFTFPALEPGAIVEFSYEVVTSDYFLAPWQFQLEEPVLYSEYRVEFPAALQYVVSAIGPTLSRLTVNESNEANRPGGRYVQHRWVMENVPALREEPFMTTPKDYSLAMRFQLAGVNIPGWGREGINNTWEKVAESFMAKDGLYGQHLNAPGRDVRDAATEAAGDATAPVEKMTRIYDYVRTRIDFNGEAGIYAESAPKDVLKDRTGDSPEINLLLVAMLREAGLTAHPVLLSTRDHGLPNTGYPILSQFNDFIAAVEIGSQRYLLDATDVLRPFDLLPYNSLNGEAWMVRHPDPAWIPVEAAGRLGQQRIVTMEIDADGRAVGHVSAANSDYAALFTRHDLKETTDHDAFVREEIFDDRTGLALDSIEVDNPDDVTLPVRVEADFTVDGFAQVAGDFLYLSPVLLGRVEDNPLKAPERTFPVDMGYGRDRVYTATLTIPEGFAVSEVPTNKQFGVQGGGALYKRVIEVDGRTIRVVSRFTISKTLFEPRQYDAMRGFYERVTSAFGEQIVLQRAAPTTSGGE